MSARPSRTLAFAAVFLCQACGGPHSRYSGAARATLTLIDADPTVQADAPVLVDRLARLGVHAAVASKRAEGLTLDVSDAVDPAAAVSAVLKPARFRIYAEALDGSGEALDRCAALPCTPVRVALPAAVGNAEIAGAALVTRPDEDVHIRLTWTAAGAERFEDLTRHQVQKRIVFTLDDEVFSVPRVMSATPGRTAALTVPDGQDPEALAACLAAGPLQGRWSITPG